MSPLQRQIAIVEEFDALTGWEERYKRLIQIGRELPPLADAERSDDSKVRGCASNVWLHADCQDGRVRLRADSDAMIVRGLIALLLRAYDGLTPQEIVDTEPMFIEELQLDQHLSQTRANGLGAMIAQIKAYGVAFTGRQAG